MRPDSDASSFALPPGRAGRLVRHHGMSLIPEEGAWFAPAYRSPDLLAAGILPRRYGGRGARPMASAIYALITRRDFSAMHRLRTDELWHFYDGEPAELLLLAADGTSEVVLFGADSLSGQRPQIMVPAGTWMGARPVRDDGEAFTFFGCTLSPAFDYGDYVPGWRDTLCAAYPDRAGLVSALTRVEYAGAPAEKTPRNDASSDGGSRVIGPEEAPVIEIAPGVSLRELAGRMGAARSETVSFARFRLEPGASSGGSRYLAGDEYFIVVSGTGEAVLGGRRCPVGPGSVVAIVRGEAHEMVADARGPLEFYTILAPAFDPAYFRPDRG